MTDQPDTKIRTRRGDLAVIERIRVNHSTSGRTEDQEFAVMVVSNLTREGRVKAVKDVRWGDSAYAQPIDRMLGFRRLYVIPQTGIDVAAALATVRAHTYSNSTTPLDYPSLDAVREALRPHLVGGEA